MGYFIESGGESHALAVGKQVLGHAGDADLSFPVCAGIAAHHAEVRPLLGGFVIKHLADSDYQTLVNGELVETCKTLSDGDVLRLGEVQWTFVVELPTTAPAHAPVELPPLPANVAQAAPAIEPAPIPVAAPPIENELPPLPANLRTSSTELPPLPGNLVPSNSEGAVPPVLEELLPHPVIEDVVPTGTPIEPVSIPSLEASIPALGELPPLGAPAVSVETSASSIGQLPALGQIMMSEPASPSRESISETSSSPNVPARPSVSADDAGKISQKIQLASSSRSKKASLWKENIVAIAATVVILGSGLVILKKRGDRLQGVGGSSDIAATSSESSTKQHAVVASASGTPVEWVEAVEDLTLNFRFYPPHHGWEEAQSSVFSSSASLVLAEERNRCQFALFAEAVGDDENANESELIGHAKHRLMVAAQTMNFRSPTAETIGGRRFHRSDSTGMLGTSHYFVTLTLLHEGFFYHLVTFGEIPQEAFIKDAALRMAERFELIDPNRHLSLSPQHQVRGFRDAYHGYGVNLDRMGWALWKNRALQFPQAQFAALSHNGMPFGIVPVRFEDRLNPSMDEFTAATLAGLGLQYPNPEIDSKDFTHEGMIGRSIMAQVGPRGRERNYYFRVLLGDEVGYLLGGWGLGRGDLHKRTLAQAMQGVEFFKPEANAPSRKLNDEQLMGLRQIRYQLGVQRLLAGDLASALDQFQRVVNREPNATELAIPLTEAFAAAGQIREGVAFMKQWQSRQNTPRVNAGVALLQCSAGDWNAGQSQLRKALVDDLVLARYLDRVTEPTQASAISSSLDAIKFSGRGQLVMAVSENCAGRHSEALAILKPLRVAFPTQPLLLKETITARIGLSQPDTALALAKSMSDPSLAAYLRGHHRRCLGKVDEAMDFFHTAVRLEPKDPFYVTELLALMASETSQQPSEVASVTPPVGEIASHGTTIERRLQLGADGDLTVQDTARFSGTAAAKFWQLFESLQRGERLERLAQMLPMSPQIELTEAAFENLDPDDGRPASLSLHYTVRGAFLSDGGMVRGTLESPLEAMILADAYILAGDKLAGSGTLSLPSGWTLVEGWQKASDDRSCTVQLDESSPRALAFQYEATFASGTDAATVLLTWLGGPLTFERMAIALAKEGDEE